VVTGNTGIPDPLAPGYNVYSIEDPSGYGTTLDDYLKPGGAFAPEFVTRGSVRDPLGNLSDLNIAVGDNADVSATDPTGKSTGLNPGTGQPLNGIAQSAYFIDSLDDDITGLPVTGTTHSIQIFQPVVGNYQITISGLSTGTDAMLVHAFAHDGSLQSSLSVPLLTTIGTTTTYLVQYSPAPGSTPVVMLSASSSGSLPSSQISTTASGLAFSRVSQTFNGTVTIQNIGNIAINGPLQIAFTSLTGVTVANATGTFAGIPYLTVPAVTSFAPGQSATVSVQFKDPSNSAINFTPVIYSGSLN
jgi:hypothetical protein